MCVLRRSLVQGVLSGAVDAVIFANTMDHHLGDVGTDVVCKSMRMHPMVLRAAF